VPTLAELGQPAANLSSLFGIYAPAQTPKTVITRINTEVNKALALPDIRAKLDATDNVPTGGTTAEFVRQIALESENNARIIRAAGIQAN
jgi:tripartite-type tricarboxylate transporter receptor subunit TctC